MSEQQRAAVAGDARQLPIPAFIDRGGRTGWTAAVGVGAGLGAASLVLPSLMPKRQALDHLGAVLGMIAGAYFGFALRDGRLREVGIETIGMLAHGRLAATALSKERPGLLAAGYFAHSAWDALHPRVLHTAIPWWYAPLCLGYDAVVGAYILARYR